MKGSCIVLKGYILNEAEWLYIITLIVYADTKNVLWFCCSLSSLGFHAPLPLSLASKPKSPVPPQRLLPCGDMSRLTLSSTSRKSSLRRYLMPSRRQPICPVTWLVIWDCSSLVCGVTCRRTRQQVLKHVWHLTSIDNRDKLCHYLMLWVWSSITEDRVGNENGKGVQV